MSKQDEHKEPDKLKDLLDKANGADMDSMDDFEKEALEGFDQLESEEEAFALKAQLDAKIDKDLFSKNSPRSAPLYWMAAAGLLLVIGLSVFFILQNTGKETTKLAISEPKTQAVTPPEPAKTKEPIASEQTKEGLKSAKSERKTRSDAQPLGSVAQEHTNRTSGAGATDKEADLAASPVAEAPLQMEEVMTAKADEDTQKEAKQMSRKSEEKFAAKETEPEITVTSSKKSKDMRMAASSPAPSVSQSPDLVLTQQSAAPTANYSYSNTNPVNASGSLSNTLMTATAFTINTCHYKGGKKALIKRLKQELESKNLSKDFEVILYINSAKAVEKVNFIKASGLSNEEKKGIETILKNLDRFYFDSSLKNGDFLPYELKYKS